MAELGEMDSFMRCGFSEDHRKLIPAKGFFEQHEITSCFLSLFWRCELLTPGERRQIDLHGDVDHFSASIAFIQQ